MSFPDDLTDRRQITRPVRAERRQAQRRRRDAPILRERRLSRRAIDLLLQDATPVRTAELARWSGFSEEFVRADIRSGEIHAVKVSRRGRHVYVVPVVEAIRYLKTLGVAIPEP